MFLYVPKSLKPIWMIIIGIARGGNEQSTLKPQG